VPAGPLDGAHGWRRRLVATKDLGWIASLA
jgi:hypothetical protein